MFTVPERMPDSLDQAIPYETGVVEAYGEQKRGRSEKPPNYPKGSRPLSPSHSPAGAFRFGRGNIVQLFRSINV